VRTVMCTVSILSMLILLPFAATAELPQNDLVEMVARGPVYVWNLGPYADTITFEFVPSAAGMYSLTGFQSIPDDYYYPLYGAVILDTAGYNDRWELAWSRYGLQFRASLTSFPSGTWYCTNGDSGDFTFLGTPGSYNIEGKEPMVKK